MVVNGRPMKRMKSRVTADLYDFLTFPSSALGSGLPLPFRSNIKAFLARHALVPPPSSLFPHLMTWQILFGVGEAATDSSSSDTFPATVCLDVVEEDVARSRSVYCDQCRVVGWSGNPVCSRRYHFIIKADGNSIGGSHKSCPRCRDMQHLSELRCKTCFHVTTVDDVEDWVYHQLEDNTHLLHGVIHSNGYGHLLRVNGREGGSRVLSGCHIMDFWDRLCKALNARKISVMDVSKKYGVEYRLLHAITNGHPWYGDWGYEFGAGSFALTLDSYKSAVETLSNLPLSNILCDGWKLHTRLQDLILFYQSLSVEKLVTLRDLFRFLTRLTHDAHKSRPVIDNAPYKKPHASGSGDNRSWTSADVERVEAAMIKVLRAVSGYTWVNSRSLRGAVCKVAPPELLDRCLKGLDGKLVAEGMVVSARCNPHSGVIEYRLVPQDVCVTTACQESPAVNCSAVRCPSEDLLMQDFRFLYSSLLHPQFMASFGHDETRDAAMSSAEKLLDCKQFVKDYKPEKLSSGSPYPAWSLYCELELVDQFEDNAPDPPAELLVLSLDDSVSDLKQEAVKAYQDVYLAFRKIQVEELVGYSGVDDSTRAKLLFKNVSAVRVRARCPGKNVNTKFRLERGVERWIVECSCGAKDDDGERMLACDICGVWQHTRCSGIHDSIAVPARFVCHRCRGPALLSHSGRQCKDESMSSVASNSSFGKSLTTPL